jgi:hypothetical protein
VEYPQVLLEEDLSPLAALVRQYSAKASADCPVEYGEHGPYVVIVYHMRRGDARGEKSPYSQVMEVVERPSGASAMHVTVDPAVSTPGSGSFLVNAGILYFVRDKKTLSAVRLR